MIGCPGQQNQLNLDFTIKSLTRGQSYGLRYRAKNAYGWGPYSTTAVLLVATEPVKPAIAPALVSSSSTDLILALAVDNIGNNGSPILDYSLEMSADSGSSFAVIDSYTSSNALQHQLNIVTDSLTLGQTYSFRMRARNDIGWG